MSGSAFSERGAQSVVAMPPGEAQSDGGSALALVPLMLSIPLMYFPKVIEGDTQPWVVVGAIVAFLFYWPRIWSRSLPLISTTAVAVLTVTAYALRNPEPQYLLRFAAVLAGFVMLWHVAARGADRMVSRGVRIAIVVWFAIGLYQTIAVRLGLPFDFFGRYVPGRSGVPSLTAEASFYGSISVLHLMYLLTEQQRRNLPYIIMATASALMSGSVLSLVLLIVPAMRMPNRYKVAGGILIVIFLVYQVDVGSSPIFARIQSLDLSSIGPDLLAQDASTNYRWGHIWFTVVSNLADELMFLNSVNFMNEYNAWAANSTLYLFTESDFIVTTGGELLFRGGVFGMILIAIVIRTAYGSGETRYERIEKVAFTIACMLNPISFSNPVFVFFIIKRYRTT